MDEGMDTLREATKSHETQRLQLDRPLPVYFLYWTALPGAGGGIEFRPDRNGRDAPLIAALSGKDGGGIKAQAAKSRLALTPSDDEDVTP